MPSSQIMHELGKANECNVSLEGNRLWLIFRVTCEKNGTEKVDADFCSAALRWVAYFLGLKY